VVTICDNGPGIPADTLPRLFEPFFTTKPPGSGTGLGLHLSHNIVVQHGGEIDVESQPGRTCFTVTLPPTLPSGTGG
jgi:signal transduction histidine kinase